MIGKTIGNRYEIVANIGEGGMGVVYKAIDKTLQRPVALKMLHRAHSNDATLNARFEIEARALAKLKHPSIVTLYDFFEAEGSHFLVMELLEGRTGKDLLEQEESIPLPELMRIFRSVIDGLAHAHRNQIIHRDIKPNNIMVTTSGEVKLMDFGIARSMDSPQVTKVGFTVGSALYMSPEQINNQNVDERSDIYSLGITMFEMATGKAPFFEPDSSEYNILIRHLSAEMPSPRAIKPELPETLERVIIKATQKKPEDRFQTMAEVASALAPDADATRIRPILPGTAAVPTAPEKHFPEDQRPVGRPLFSHMNPGSLFLLVVVLVSLALIGVLAVRWFSEPGEKHDLVQPDRQLARPEPEASDRSGASAKPGSPGAKTTETPEQIQPKATLPPPQPPTAVKISKFKAIYLKKGKGPLELKDADTLTSEDRYCVLLSPDEELYLYVAQVDSADIISPIFPNPQFSQKNNPLAPNVEYRFPEKEYFYLGGGRGKEHLYVIASRNPNERLEDIYKELASADEVKVKQLSKDFINIYNEQNMDNVKAIWFWHK
jgi:serine/threonine protein kinase